MALKEKYEDLPLFEYLKVKLYGHIDDEQVKNVFHSRLYREVAVEYDRRLLLRRVKGGQASVLLKTGSETSVA